jgi:hypothetical protein
VPYTGKLDEVMSGLQPSLLSPDRIKALFGENLDDKLQWLQRDIDTLAHIESGDIDTRSFDFDGRKYPAGEAADVRQVLETELKTTGELRDQRDTEAAAAFLAHALATSAAQADSLKSAYQNLHVWTSREAAFVPPAREIFTTIQMLAGNNYNVAIELAQPFRDLYTLHEPALRRFFVETPELDAFSGELQEKIRAVFLGDAIEYHAFNEPEQDNLNQLLEVCVQTADEFSKIIFKQHKALLELQQAIYQD